MVVVENVKFVAGGINTNAIAVPRAKIKDCRTEINTPFIIDRHRFGDSGVYLSAADGSEVSASEFYGGQGCLVICGKKDIQIHDNLFVNRQTVTNHYSLGLQSADNVKVFRNRFEPEIGSGIEIFGAKDNEIYENTFKIVAANGNCEYANNDYSTNAIRMTDYDSKEGAPKGVWGNKIHNNKFEITGKNYTNYKGCMPVATAIFCSVGGGKNYVSDNEIVVDHKDPATAAIACAFYIGASSNGGEYVNNKVTTNVPAFWIGCFYGNGANVKVKDNTIIKAANAPADFKPFRFGYWKYTAQNIEFSGNKFENCQFGIQADNLKAHTWTEK
jgi:nitrous oxidase accessory protein NosD